MIKENFILISGATVYKEARGKVYWLIVKHSADSDWEIPKATVRKGESSVRAILRVLGELGGMTVKILEEVGRSNTSTIVNNKSIPQKFIYYLLIFKASAGEIIGFSDYEWLELPKAVQKLSLKREKDMLKEAKEVLKTWQKLHSRKP